MALPHQTRTAMLLAAAISFWIPFHCPAREYAFDLDTIEKRPYHLGGYAEVTPILFGLDRDAALYRLLFYDRDEGSTLNQYNMTLQLDGSYEKGMARAFVRTSSHLDHTYDGWSGKTTLYEGFLSLKPSPSLTVDMGKKTLKWGKGYAWNPAAFLDRPRDPNDPALALEGFVVASLDYIRSFDGPLKAFSFTPAVLPVYGDMNKDFGKSGHVNVAARFYFLFLDTDIDFMFLSGGSKPSRYGADFSRNVSPHFEVHGEVARIRDFGKSRIDREGTLSKTRYDAWSGLLGIRYLTARETTYIIEYYRNGTGFTETEMEDYFSFINKGYDEVLAAGDDSSLQKASALAQGEYGGRNPMMDYLYLRVSQKEPFDILYFTPALTWIFNVDDRSFSLSPELSYTGITNLDLRLKAVFLAGKRLTEYGEKPNDYRLELRVRYYF